MRKDEERLLGGGEPRFSNRQRPQAIAYVPRDGVAAQRGQLDFSNLEEQNRFEKRFFNSLVVPQRGTHVHVSGATMLRQSDLFMNSVGVHE